MPFDKVYPNAPGAIDPVTPGNLAGIPAMSVPNGFGEHGLPTGLGLLGNAWAETQLAAIAARYQRATPFHKERPPLPA